MIAVLTLVVLPLNLRAALPAQFGPVTNFYAGGMGSYYLPNIASGDFNGDGTDDIAVAYSGVDVFLGQGGGNFSVSSTNTGIAGEFLAAGDFNNDGKLDLLVVNASGGTVLLGDGKGHFPTRTNISGLSATPGGFAVGDFNGDGNLDVVIVADYGMFLAFGRGDGSFNTTNYDEVFGHSQSPFDNPPDAGYMRASDLRKRGQLDLVIAMSGSVTTNSFCVMTNKGGGPFAAPVYYITTNLSDLHYALNVSDFNADGKPDVAALNYNSHSVSIWMNKGDGTFFLATNISVPGVSPTSVAAADFNGDAKMDLIVRGGSAARILTGNGDGSFTVGALMNVPADNGASSSDTLVAGNFSGRGMPDLALVNPPATSVAIMLNQTPPMLTLAPMANYCQITWLKTFGAGYALEYTTNISTPGNWQTFPYPPVVLGNQKAVTDWTSPGQRFYRLRK